MISYMLNALIQSTLSVSVIFLLFKALSFVFDKKIGARARVWTVGFLCIRLVVLVNVNIPFFSQKNFVSKVQNSIQNFLSDSLGNGFIKSAVINTAQTEAVSAETVIFVIWITGMVVTALIQIFKYIYFKRQLFIKSRSVGTLYELGKEYDVKLSDKFDKVYVRYSYDISSPFVIGLVKKYMYLPSYDISKEDMRLIIEHEAIHIRQNDLWWKFLFLVSRIIHWFNPIIYLMLKSGNEYIELSCDSEVVKEFDYSEKKRYAEMLLYMINSADKRYVLTTGFSKREAKLSRRFNYLFIGKQNSAGWILAVFAGIALLAAQNIWAVETADIFDTGVTNSYVGRISIQRNVSGKNYEMSFSDMYYSIYDISGNSIHEIDRVSNAEKIVIAPGEILYLYPSLDKMNFGIEKGEVVTVAYEISDEIRLRTGLTNGSVLETTDSSPEVTLVQEENEGSVVFINNVSSNEVILY